MATNARIVDVPMARVKFNVNSEYAYIQNFKILQSERRPADPVWRQNSNSDHTDAFTKHRVDRSVPVEALVKCKMQDNLDFLQFSKRYWDKYYPGGEYDALARRKGQSGSAAPMVASGGGARRPAGGAAGPRTRTPNMGGGGASAALSAENSALKETVAGLERERDFYFSKLRDIELLIQQAIDANPELEKDEDGILKQIQTILYSTEVSRGGVAQTWHESNRLYRRALRFRQRLRVNWLKRRRSRAQHRR
jgi:RP/EB family microtubule-associated protein